MTSEKWLPTSHIEQYVKTLSLDFIATMNTRNFDGHGCQHISPQLNAIHDAEHHSASTDSKEATLDFMNRFLDANPRYRTKVLDVSVDLNEAEDKADVWILRTCEGLADYVRRENICHLTWQRQDGDFYCVHYEAIRYFPFFSVESLHGGGL